MNLKEPKGRLARWQIFMGFSELEDAGALSRLCINAADTDKQLDRVNTVLKNEEGRIIVVPEKKMEILRLYHDDPGSGGHDGFWRTYLKLKQRFIWPKMKIDVLN